MKPTNLARRATLGAIALSALLALGACSRVPDVVKIGVGQPMTGGLGREGKDMLNGVQLAVDEINADGGVSIAGKKVRLEIVSGDDKSDPEVGKQVAKTLVDADVIAVIAHLNSGVSIPTAPIYADAKVPQLAISTKPDYTKLGLPTTLRMVANDELQSRAMGSYAAELPGASRFAVVDDGTPYGKWLADNAAKVITDLKREVVIRKTLDDKTTEFAALIGELKSAKADVVVNTLSSMQVEALVDQMAEAGLSDLSVLGGDTLKTNTLKRQEGKVKAIYATSPIVEAREFPNGRIFLEKFRARFKDDPVYGAHYAYDAVYQIADALARNESVDKEKLLERLKTFDGSSPVTSALRFGADGEQRYGTVAVYQLRRGEWSPLMRSDRW